MEDKAEVVLPPPTEIQYMPDNDHPMDIHATNPANKRKRTPSPPPQRPTHASKTIFVTESQADEIEVELSLDDEETEEPEIDAVSEPAPSEPTMSEPALSEPGAETDEDQSMLDGTEDETGSELSEGGDFLVSL